MIAAKTELAAHLKGVAYYHSSQIDYRKTERKKAPSSARGWSRAGARPNFRPAALIVILKSCEVDVNRHNSRNLGGNYICPNTYIVK